MAEVRRPLVHTRHRAKKSQGTLASSSQQMHKIGRTEQWNREVIDIELLATSVDGNKAAIMLALWWCAGLLHMRLSGCVLLAETRCIHD